MPTRSLPFVLVVLGLVACLPPPVKNVVDCQQVWRCGDQEIASENDGEEDLCLDVADPDRQTTIDEHTAELQNDCNALEVNCIGGEHAVCTATCTPTTNECGVDAGS